MQLHTDLDTTQLKKIKDVILSETKNLKNVGQKIFRFVQNDNKHAICPFP